jgi:hypothetical protein
LTFSVPVDPKRETVLEAGLVEELDVEVVEVDAVSVGVVRPAFVFVDCEEE